MTVKEVLTLKCFGRTEQFYDFGGPAPLCDFTRNEKYSASKPRKPKLVVTFLVDVGKRKRRRHRRDKSMLTSDLADILSSILKETVHLWTTPLVAPLDNNLAARSVAAQVLSLSGSIPFEEFYENKKDDAVVQEFGGEPYVIPPRSRFISSYFRDIVCVIEDSKKYDIIVMDPPWNNKSAKRLCTYDYLQESDLRNIPIKELATEGALIVLWITNNERLKAFVENDLFPGIITQTPWALSSR